ncbi:hypothetical protein MGWOODY_Smn1161 [hydrothermal vent metagenome]|uniref:Uncharacterized protein n=1 Tax=hydrothermal vent metagenome TaxID=652676 RepID=A0A160TLT0_9ZZZZ
MAECASRLGGDIDLAVLQPLDELVGRDIDDLDLRVLQDAVGHRLAHPNPGEAGDHVVEAFDMLDVEGREDVDAGVEQFLDILPALGVAAALDIGVGELVDQHERRATCQDRIEIHFGQCLAAIIDGATGDHLERRDQCLGLGAAMGLDYADHHVDAGPQPSRALVQHLIGLADPGCGAEEYLELPARLTLRGAEQGIGGGAFVGDGAPSLLQLLTFP